MKFLNADDFNRPGSIPWIRRHWKYVKIILLIHQMLCQAQTPFTFLHNQLCYAIWQQEQYRYLHHALVHTLTLPWEPVKVDNFPQYIQQNKGAKLHEQFKVFLLFLPHTHTDICILK